MDPFDDQLAEIKANLDKRQAEDAVRIDRLKAKWAKRDAQREKHEANMAAQHQAERDKIATLIADALRDNVELGDEDPVYVGGLAYDAIEKAGYIFAWMDKGNGWENK